MVWPDVPGRVAIERYLNKGSARPCAGDLVLFEIEESPDDPAALENAVAWTLLDRLGEHSAYVFTLRCPVVFRSELRDMIRALGPDDLVNLASCEHGTRRP
jgi:hypothetical protein